MASRHRIMVYFTDGQTLKDLELWSKEENRSISNLAATLLAKAVADKKTKRTEDELKK